MKQHILDAVKERAALKAKAIQQKTRRLVMLTPPSGRRKKKSRKLGYTGLFVRIMLALLFILAMIYGVNQAMVFLLK